MHVITPESKSKHALSALDVLAITKELREVLPARVNAIREISEFAPALVLYFPGIGEKTLVLDRRGFVFLTSSSVASSSKASFTATLGRLRSTWLREAVQLDFDRAIRFGFSEGYELIYELIGKGNLVLLHDGNVISATEYFRKRGRSIIPGLSYAPPPLRGASLDDDVPVQGPTLIQAMTKAYNCPAELFEEAFARLDISPTLPPSQVSSEILKRVRATCLEIIEEVSQGKLSPNVVYENDAAVDVHPLFFRKHSRALGVPKDTFNDALSTYWEPWLSRLASEESTSESNQQAERANASAKKSRAVAEGYAHRATALGKLAQTLSSSPQEFAELLVLSRLNKEAQASARAERLGVGFVLANGIKLTLKSDGEAFDFDPRDSGFVNLGKLYEEIKELKRKAAEAESNAIKLEEQARTIENQLSRERLRVATSAIRRRKWYEKFRWFFTSEGILTIAGRDASQNSAIVRRYAKPGYTVMHADVQGAAVTLVMGNATQVSISEAAQFAASFSRAWGSGLSSVDVFYADSSKTSLSAPSGEYLAKGSVVFLERNYLRGITLSISLGVYEVEPGEYRVAVWPTNLPSRGARVVLEPGPIDRNQLAKRVLNILRAKEAERKEFVETLRADDILPLLPGSSRILLPS